MLALGEVLGPARSAAATDADFDVLPLAPVELQRRRVDRNGKVKIRLSLAGVRVSKCAVRRSARLARLTGQICLVQFRADDLGTIWPECLHCFHASACCDAPSASLTFAQRACVRGSFAVGPARAVARRCIPRHPRPRLPDFVPSHCTPSSRMNLHDRGADDQVCTGRGRGRGVQTSRSHMCRSMRSVSSTVEQLPSSGAWAASSTGSRVMNASHRSKPVSAIARSARLTSSASHAASLTPWLRFLRGFLVVGTSDELSSASRFDVEGFESWPSAR